MTLGHTTRVTLKADEIRSIRHALEMTQAQLARVLGVSRESVVRWENGSRTIAEPTSRLLLRMSSEGRRKARKR